MCNNIFLRGWRGECLKLSLHPPNGESYVFTVGVFVCLSVYLCVSNIMDVDGTLLDVEATVCHRCDMLCFGAISAKCCLSMRKVQETPVLTTWHLSPKIPLIARFTGPTWGPSGADRTQVDPMLVPWTLLSGPRSKEYVPCFRSAMPHGSEA